MKIPNTMERDCLLDEIRAEVLDTQRFTGVPELEQRVMEALRQTPRDEFVPHELRYGAYANRPLPIGHGQTISQPYVVALMTGLIQPQPQPRVPPALIEQLKPGGTLVIPVGLQHVAQDLRVIRKRNDGSIEEKHVLPVVFVPLTGSPCD